MDETKFVTETLKRQTLRKLSRRIESGAARTVPVFIGGPRAPRERTSGSSRPRCRARRIRPDSGEARRATPG